MVASTHGHDIFVSLILVYKSNLMLLILLISVVGTFVTTIFGKVVIAKEQVFNFAKRVEE
jgi:hypothetical protein